MQGTGATGLPGEVGATGPFGFTGERGWSCVCLCIIITSTEMLNILLLLFY